MSGNIIKKFLGLELEEKILNGGALLACAGLFFPWLGGEWLGGETVSYSGFGFYTSFIGIAVFLLHLCILLITAVPLTGGPVLIRKRYKELARLLLSVQATIFTVAIWTVLIRFTFEFSRLEIHFGLYCTLIGSLVTGLYAFLRYQEQRKLQVKELFHHPDIESLESIPSRVVSEREPPPPPPPPPPPSEPEEHRLYR